MRRNDLVIRFGARIAAPTTVDSVSEVPQFPDSRGVVQAPSGLPLRAWSGQDLVLTLDGLDVLRAFATLIRRSTKSLTIATLFLAVVGLVFAVVFLVVNRKSRKVWAGYYMPKFSANCHMQHVALQCYASLR